MDHTQTLTFRLRHDGVVFLRHAVPWGAWGLIHLRAAQLGGPGLQGRLVVLCAGLYLARLALILVAERFFPPATAPTRPKWRRRLILHVLGPGLLAGALLGIVSERLHFGTTMACALVLAAPAQIVAHQGAQALSRAHAYALRARTGWPQAALWLATSLLADSFHAESVFALALALAPLLTAAVVLASCRRVVYVNLDQSERQLLRSSTLALEQLSWFGPLWFWGLLFAPSVEHASDAQWIATVGLALALASCARVCGAQLQLILERREGPTRHERVAQSPRDVLGSAGILLLFESLLLVLLLTTAPLLSRCFGRGYGELARYLLALVPATLASTAALPLREDLLLRNLSAAELRASVALLLTSCTVALVAVPGALGLGLAWALSAGQLVALGLRAMWWVSLRRVRSGDTARAGVRHKSI